LPKRVLAKLGSTSFVRRLTMNKESVCIGIPCFHSVTHEVLEDYMRFAYYLGRRCQGYDFFLAIKPKTAQHRARNAIVQAAIATNCDYLLMLDDDHIIDIEKTIGPGEQYNLAVKLIDHLKEDPKKGIVGALYYQRGSSCEPVIMYKNPPGYTFYQHHDISRRLQKVDVTGGGCMMIRMSVFDKIESPWFMDEMSVSQGTDIQICEKVSAAGWEVWCDTSIEVGHIISERQVITSKNAHEKRVAAAEWMDREDIRKAPRFKTSSFIDKYGEDVRAYTGKTEEQLYEMREEYAQRFFPVFNIDDLDGYYSSLGDFQIARNYGFHMLDWVKAQSLFMLSLFSPNVVAHGLDFGCGSAPVGFELALRGHAVDFVDVPGGASEKFLKWRCKKYNITNHSFKMGDDYDWVLMLDSIEHLHPDKSNDILKGIIEKIKLGGSIITNYFMNQDHANIEHINMFHYDVRKLFEKEGLTMVPIVNPAAVVKDVRWVKA
jgi:SAM-dependent methyltransferase